MAILIMLLIFAASSTPGDDLPSFGAEDFLVKKGGHMLGYALLAIGYLRGLSERKPVTLRTGILAVFLAGLYATTDEFHQLFVTGRNASPYDVMIDTIGATFGACIWTWFRSMVSSFAGRR